MFDWFPLAYQKKLSIKEKTNQNKIIDIFVMMLKLYFLRLSGKQSKLNDLEELVTEAFLGMYLYMTVVQYEKKKD